MKLRLIRNEFLLYFYGLFVPYYEQNIEVCTKEEWKAEEKEQWEQWLDGAQHHEEPPCHWFWERAELN
jgi:hypothetical protein